MKPIQQIEMKPVKSSNIEAVGHDAASNTLRIKFRSGGTYDYAGPDAKKHAALTGSKSIGSYFHKHIIGTYPHIQVEE